MRFHWMILAALLLSITATADAQRKKLSVGDPAPDMRIAAWVHGNETSISSGNVYVVKFWATWCAPCNQAIPKLSKLQKRYAGDGLVIIAISSEEQEKVENFVSRRSGDIEYRVAVDQRDNCKRAWMSAANRDTIPTAFIVDRQGRVQFIGSPHDEEFERVLSAVIENRYDARLFKQAEPKLEAAKSARRVRNWNLCFRHYDEVINLSPTVFAWVNLEKFEIMLVDQDEQEAAYTFANELIDKHSDNARFLINIAQKIATDPKIPNEKRDLAVAMKAANMAGSKLGPDNPEGLAIRAEVNFHMGNVSEAITLQRRAWMVASPDRKDGYQRTLRAYREAQGRIEARGG